MEKMVSPGVFTNEYDKSYLPSGIGSTGAVVIGPTVKGPARIPTIVGSYDDFKKQFGTTFESGSNSYQYLTSYAAKQYLKYADNLMVVRIADYDDTRATASISYNTESSQSFELKTHGVGSVYNSAGPTGSNNVLRSGSENNYRWEVSGVNDDKGTFNLYIRRGDDTDKRKIVLESYNGLTLDPNDNNYIARVIGDTVYNFDGTNIQPSGSYQNKSKYVYVSSIDSQTINYLDNNGDIRNASLSSSLPTESSGSFNGGSTTLTDPQNFYGDITETNSQGYDPSSEDTSLWTDVITLLENKDEYDINLLLTPGIFDEEHSSIVQAGIDMCEDRGDCMYVYDQELKGSTNMDTIVSNCDKNTSYAATYWPWVQIQDAELNQYNWIPASVVMAGVYAFNDKVSYEWYAPAGLNRGGIEDAVRVEYKLSHTDRDTLYDGNVNPITSFPNEGIVPWGQKTLQKKASALDRVNVRRLLINLKKYIVGVSRRLVFEQNTRETRKAFLNKVIPYMQSVKQKQGLYVFTVKMDEENNTPDVIDRNILKGEIWIQPSKTAEFISIDFNIEPTGTEFAG